MSPRVATLREYSCHRDSGWLRPTLAGLALCLALGLGCGGSGTGGGAAGSPQSSTAGAKGSGGATTNGGTTSPGGTVGSAGSIAPGGTTGTGGGGAGSTASSGSAGTGGSTAGGGGTTASGTAGTGGRSGSGGTGSTGGIAGTAGRSGSGGSTSGSGGSTVTGGVTETGGATSTGGVGNTGGRSGTGGSSSTGGSTGSGGRSGTGGSAAGAPGTGGTGAAGSSGNGAPVPSSGCGKDPPATLKNGSSGTANQNTIGSRQFLIRWPTNYDNTHPYRLILGFHGANGKDTDIAPSYFGLFDLSNNSTIFVAPSANGGIWDATADTSFVKDILTTVEADLCIDTSRVMLEGFSQGGAMIAVLACGMPGVFRAAVGHSRGGLTAPTTCQPIPYLGSLGLTDISGNSQATQTDPFAKWNGCTVSTMPLAATGSHVCTNYTGCPAADPVIYCSYDGGHTPSPNDAGKSTSWMPAEVWSFFSPI